MTQMNYRTYVTYLNAVDMAADIEGEPIFLGGKKWYSISLLWEDNGDNPTGTIKIQQDNGVDSWEDISGATVSVSGASGTTIIANTVPQSSSHIRVIYTRISGGSGDLLSAAITIKE